VRKDENIVALHRMRIATRRLRAAMRLFGPYLPAKQVRRVEKGLRQMARVLGSVRDFDVLLNKAQNYSENIPENKQRSLELLLRRWHKQRAKARKKMMKSFRSRTGESVWDAFEDFLHEKPETDNVERKGASVHRPRGDLLHYIAPTLIWKRYDRIRRYETVVNGASVETLHKLRIQCKRLRYTLELLHEILGASVESAIAQVKKAQDYLGELHDTDVTAHLVQDFLDRCARRRKRRAIAAADVKGVTDYLAACEKEIEEKIKHFSIIWEELVSEQFRTLLGELTATP
jgi:CHAD domain-containing protein